MAVAANVLRCPKSARCETDVMRVCCICSIYLGKSALYKEGSNCARPIRTIAGPTIPLITH
jgi:hypothetical protein